MENDLPKQNLLRRTISHPLLLVTLYQIAFAIIRLLIPTNPFWVIGQLSGYLIPNAGLAGVPIMLILSFLLENAVLFLSSLCLYLFIIKKQQSNYQLRKNLLYLSAILIFSISIAQVLKINDDSKIMRLAEKKISNMYAPLKDTLKYTLTFRYLGFEQKRVNGNLNMIVNGTIRSNIKNNFNLIGSVGGVWASLIRDDKNNVVIDENEQPIAFLFDNSKIINKQLLEDISQAFVDKFLFQAYMLPKKEDYSTNPDAIINYTSIQVENSGSTAEYISSLSDNKSLYFLLPVTMNKIQPGKVELTDNDPGNIARIETFSTGHNIYLTKDNINNSVYFLPNDSYQSIDITNKNGDKLNIDQLKEGDIVRVYYYKKTGFDQPYINHILKLQL